MARRQRRSSSPSRSGPTLGAGVPTESSRWNGLILRIAEYALLAVVGFAVARTLYANAKILVYPYEANFGEGGVLYDALRLSRGQTIYAPAISPEWLSPYPPLYAAMVALTGAHSWFWPRSISQISHAASGIALAYVLRRLGLAWRWAVLGAGLWFANPFERTFAAMARVDMLGRALESATVAWVVVPPLSVVRLMGAALFSALAMTTKQTMFAGAVAVTGWLAVADRRRAGVFATSWLLLTLAAYVIVVATLGPHFIANVFRDVKREFQWSMFWPWLGGFVITSFFVLLPAVVGCAVAWRDPRRRLLIWAAAAGLPSVLLAANDGADVNYFFDLTWAVCALAAVGCARIAEASQLRAVSGLAVLAGGFLFMELAAPPVYPTAVHLEKGRRVVEFLARAPRPVLSEFVGFGLAVGSEPPAIPYLDRKLEESGLRTSRQLVDRIARQEFGAILLTSQAGGRWSPSVLAAIETNYRQALVLPEMFAAEGSPHFILLEPRRPPVLR